MKSRLVLHFTQKCISSAEGTVEALGLSGSQIRLIFHITYL